VAHHSWLCGFANHSRERLRHQSHLVLNIELLRSVR
jgi:hypothetical protein